MEPSIQTFVEEIKETPVLREFLQKAVPMLFDISKPPIHRKIGIEALAEGLDVNVTTAYEDLESKIREIIQTSMEARHRLRFVTKRPIRYNFWPEFEGELLCFIVKNEFVNGSAEERKKIMFGFLEEQELYWELEILSADIGNVIRDQPAWFADYVRSALSVDFSLSTEERRVKLQDLGKQYFTEDQLQKVVAVGWMEKIMPFLFKFFPENHAAAYSIAKMLSFFADQEFLSKNKEEQQKWIKETLNKYKNM